LNSYLASIIVLIGVFITINQSKKQDKENFRLQHMPYIEVEYFSEIPSRRAPGSIIFGKSENHTHKIIGYINITNKGFGPALDFSIVDISYNYLHLNSSLRGDKILKPEESIEVLIMGFFKLPDIEKQRIDNFHKTQSDVGLGPLYFDINYYDFIGNKYTVEIQIPYYLSGQFDENGKRQEYFIKTGFIKSSRTTPQFN
jgi:hypothetical protein